MAADVQAVTVHADVWFRLNVDHPHPADIDEDVEALGVVLNHRVRDKRDDVPHFGYARPLQTVALHRSHGYWRIDQGFLTAASRDDHAFHLIVDGRGLSGSCDRRHRAAKCDAREADAS